MKYSRMRHTRAEVIIVDEFVEIAWQNSVKRHYTDAGYNYTADGAKFLCMVKDLHPGSAARVRVNCPYCGDERVVAYRYITKSGHTLCRSCGSRHDLFGLRFGRLSVLDMDRSSSKARWLCKCDCGTEKSVSATCLVSGLVRSCGCYRDDVARSRKGPLSPSWNPNLTENERVAKRYQKREWAQAVFGKDKYTCQVCGKIGGRLNAHHLYSHADYPQYRKSIRYGITMCESEHQQFHRWMGGTRVPCTPDDFYTWLNEISI